MIAGWRTTIDEWARGRLWQPRAIVIVGMLWLAVPLTLDPGRATIFAGIDLGIHEAGHPLFRFGGEVLHALGGTLLQLAAPIAAVLVLARIPDWFGVGFCGLWLGVNLYEVAHYMADARALALPLVTIGGGDANHDWNFLFGRFGCLRADTAIAGFVKVLAFLALWGSIAACSWIVWRIGRGADAPRTSALDSIGSIDRTRAPLTRDARLRTGRDLRP